MTEFGILSVLTLLVAVALWLNKPALTLTVLAILLIVVVWRDLGIPVYRQSLMDEMYRRGAWTQDFMAGADAITDFCASTRYFLYAAAVFIFALAARGLGRSKR